MSAIAAAVLAMGGFGPAAAQDIDPVVEGAKHCTRYLPRFEREYGIPVHLLSAIATTESGRWHQGLKIKLPWPWAVGAEGKGNYYASKQEAVAAVKKLQARGVRNIDVGCMQVNMMHHGRAFASIEEAFEPQHNVAYAAYFLRDLYQGEGSWKKAASAYHSKTSHLGAKYVSRVYDSWYKIIDKVRSAQAQTAVASAAPAPKELAIMQTPAQLASLAPSSGGAKPASGKPAVKVAKKLPEHKSPRMKVIKLGKPAKKDDVVVYRPQQTSSLAKDGKKQSSGEIKLADAKVASGGTKLVRAGGNGASGRTGPNFIFDN